jgi:hypothetical protein
VTHCSATKDDSLRDTGLKVAPDQLYTSQKIKGFMNECKGKRVKCAIFSDKYGVWFLDEMHEWYEKSPKTITTSEYRDLVKNFEQRLAAYDEIWFYYNAGRFPLLYRKLLNEVNIKDKITLFTHKDQIR